MASPYDINVGELDELTQNTPAAGAEATFTNVAFGRVRLLYLSFRFFTDANATNRMIRITNTRGVRTWTVGAANIQVPANNLLDCIATAGAIGQASISADHLQISMPEILLLEPGDVLTTAILNMQVGDEITLIHNDVLVFPIFV